MRAALQIAVILIALAAPAFAQDQAQAKGGTPVSTAVTQAFEQYEQVRVALAADNFADASAHAKGLAQRAEAAAGVEAKKAADELAAAKNIEDARKAFGDLSTLLVPVFQAASIPGTTAYTCPMKQKPWMQKGDKMANPYYGKSMLTCGTVLPPKAK